MTVALVAAIAAIAAPRARADAGDSVCEFFNHNATCAAIATSAACTGNCSWVSSMKTCTVDDYMNSFNSAVTADDETSVAYKEGYDQCRSRTTQSSCEAVEDGSCVWDTTSPPTCELHDNVELFTALICRPGGLFGGAASTSGVVAALVGAAAVALAA